MSDQLLFHEKCNRDVREILDSLDKRSTEEENKRTEFLVRLTEAYQLIYESATSSSIPIHEMDIPWNRSIPKRMVRVHGFNYFVVFTVMSKKTTVILGVINSLASFNYLLKNPPPPPFPNNRNPQ